MARNNKSKSRVKLGNPRTKSSGQSTKTFTTKGFSSNSLGVGDLPTGKAGKLKPTITASGKKQKTLKDLFHDGLKDVYSAEKQLIQALPKLVDAAGNEELKTAFSDHLEQTKKQVQRLEKIMQYLGVSGLEECEAMKGLIRESDDIIKNYQEGAVKDSALIIGAQKVEHY